MIFCAPETLTWREAATADERQRQEPFHWRDSQGRPYGGGRADKGGFQLPLGVLAETSDEEALWSLVHEIVHQRVSRVIPELGKKQRAELRDKSG